jgi:hypothetical protein
VLLVEEDRSRARLRICRPTGRAHDPGPAGRNLDSWMAP